MKKNKLMKRLYNILDYPFIYNILQLITSIGRKNAIRFIENIMVKESKGRICDIGCGTGTFARNLNNKYFGVDLNPKYFNNTSNKNRFFICADGVFLPFKCCSFDSVFSICFLHHIDEVDLEKVFIEVRRVIKYGGHFVIVDIFYPENGRNFIGYFLSRFDRGRFVKKYKDFNNLLRKYFIVKESNYIDSSFPQNMHYFIAI